MERFALEILEMLAFSPKTKGLVQNLVAVDDWAPFSLLPYCSRHHFQIFVETYLK